MLIRKKVIDLYKGLIKGLYIYINKQMIKYVFSYHKINYTYKLFYYKCV